MSYSNDDSGSEIYLYRVLDEIENGLIKSRKEQLNNLKAIFDKPHEAKNLDSLSDKTYHHIYEVVFKVALDEKTKVYSTKKGGKPAEIAPVTVGRIKACAGAFRAAVKAGASKLKPKTIDAVIDHITQTLLRADGGFFEPLAPDYLKALLCLFEHQAHVERLKPAKWKDVVTFCLTGINRYLDDYEITPNSLIHSSSGFGGRSASGSLVSSSLRSGNSQNKASTESRQNAEDLLNILLPLISAPNIPLLRAEEEDAIDKAEEVVESVFRFLRSQGSAVSTVYQVAFSILNNVLFFCREDRCSLLQNVGQQAIPIICRFWQGKTSAKDELLNSVRDEMLILLFTVHLHLERSVLDDLTMDLSLQLSDLADVMRAEYVRRSDRDQLQLDDLDIADLGSTAVESIPFQLATFRLRSHNSKAERNWANLQVIGLLEKIVALGQDIKQTEVTAGEDGIDFHPRKRQRTNLVSDRLLDNIRSDDENVRLAELQILPFVLQDRQLAPNVLEELLIHLQNCFSDKRGNISSWALLAFASCTHQKSIQEVTMDWVQTWHLGARALTFSATCRAAATQLHAVLAAKLITYPDIAEVVDSMITAVDINGPVVLCDSSIFLMMHLLNDRVTEVPGASLVACQHVTRWLLARWNPAERSLTSFSSPQIRPHYIADLLRTTLGLMRMPIPLDQSITCGHVAQSWQRHLNTQGVVRYLLLLKSSPSQVAKAACSSCPKYSDASKVCCFLDNVHYKSTQKLVLELVVPKASDLNNLWQGSFLDRSSAVSAEAFRRAIHAYLTMLILTPHFVNSNSPQLDSFEEDLEALAHGLLKFIRDLDSKDFKSSQLLIEALLQAVQPYLPEFRSNSFADLSTNYPRLLKFFILIADELTQRRIDHASSSTGLDDEDMMDLDGNFSIQQSQNGLDGQSARLPRRDTPLQMSTISFSIAAKSRLMWLKTMAESPHSSAYVPSTFIDYLLRIGDDEILACRLLVQGLLQSNLHIQNEDAMQLLEHFGGFLSSDEWSRCETTHGICLDILYGLASLWTQADESELTENALQLYKWFIATCLGKNLASAAVQKSIAKLLLLLMRLDSDGVVSDSVGLPSYKTSLIGILQAGNASVQFYIGNHLPDYFEIFILKDHDDAFVDILEHLPGDPHWIEGIAFRLYVFARLGSRWTTLLRRCIYHIFETPPRVPKCTEHATRCLLDISSAVAVSGPQELFALFAPQILYTWLELEDIRALPYQLFGFATMKDLLKESQHLAAGLMVMRAQRDAFEYLADLLGISQLDLMKNSFTKIMAYSIGYSVSTRPKDVPKGQVPGEILIKDCLDANTLAECIALHFVEIIIHFFNMIDHGDIMKQLSKEEDMAYAAHNLQEIKSFNSSDANLPPSQQPTLKARYLPKWIRDLCTKTDASIVYTPALVVSIARSLLDTIHPVLGSLHACSVLRKLRVLISLAGASAFQGYPLEMLLQSVSAFIPDSECVEDALGIMQYLLYHGKGHLDKSPSLVAGITLSILGSLRAFLESPQASTTQESQYRNSRTKAEGFRRWMRVYIAGYDSPNLGLESQRETFQALMKLAGNIELAGTAESGTYEGDLLIQLLKDEQAEKGLLSRPSRESTLKMICASFQTPKSFRTDILGDHELSISFAAVVWRFCQAQPNNKQYLSWAARVLGRAFAASGHIHKELLRESSLSYIRQLSTLNGEDAEDNSQACLLNLLQALTLAPDQQTVGLAEAALRLIITDSDDYLRQICSQHLSHALVEASSWHPYFTPPSEKIVALNDINGPTDLFDNEAINKPCWLRDLTVFLIHCVPLDPLLQALTPILRDVPGFADRAFPFILHLVLSIPSNNQRSVKQNLSKAFINWFRNNKTVEKVKLKILINAILYLRTQPLAHEKSTADRSHWLEIDYIEAAKAATCCGMFKTALLFAEESSSVQISAKSSRRSSAMTHESQSEGPSRELLLTIFQNIDDPDLFYGVQQIPSLSTILSRFEYEKDGPKSLAFRGAQYDSNVRRRDPESAQDVHSLVNALDVLNLSGLSNSLLQAQQTIGMSNASLDSMFRTARKLEQWDIPVPSSCSSDALTIYKAFQAVQNAPDHPSMLQTINESFDCTMSRLISEDLNASALHGTLQTLAALTELDEVISTRGSVEFEEILPRFKQRSSWMKTGRFDDISDILSCRGTTLSLLSRQPRLQNILNLLPMDTRLVEVQTALLAADLNRSHNALQESLNLATFLIGLVKPCQELGLNLEVAVRLEAANALWDQGEMSSSIGMLQELDNPASLKKQNAGIVVARSELLSKIGSQVSVARLEKPDKILENYLKPALKELKDDATGRGAGQVFHQFATFCDQQLQDVDGLEDLERLKKLSNNKRDDVESLTKMIASASTRDKERYRGHLNKNKTWLRLDEDELQRHISSREEFLRQCLENYLLAMCTSDDHDSNALRFSALWLEHSEARIANEAVAKHLGQVPSRKFAPLMNQLTSRLQDTKEALQQLLFVLIVRICKDHPYHGMYQIYAGANSRANQKDEAAVLRHSAANKVLKQLLTDPKSSTTWQSIQVTSRVYCQLAAEKQTKLSEPYKSGRKVKFKDSDAACRLLLALPKHPIPPPTLQIKLAPDCDYSQVPKMESFEQSISIASGVSAPKIITAVGSNGVKYRQLVKGSNDDLRQDAIMEQVFEQVSELLKTNRSTRQRNLSIRTYKVLPLTSIAGVIEFVPNTIPLHEYLMPAHEKYFPKDLKGNQCRKEISDAQGLSVADRVKKFRSVTDRFHPVMRYFFTEKFMDPDEWFVKRLAYARSTAAISILGHVLGLGDRHGHNILLDAQSGEVVHIDLGVAFEMGRVLPVPELVPFRLTRDIVDGMGITKTEGVFRRCCEFTLEALRKESYSIMTILDVLRYDPLYNWSISPLRMAKLQEGQSAAPEAGAVPERTKERVNEPGEADRALTVVNKKLSKTLSVTATVHDLINQAMDERNLAVLYSGWAAYA